MTVAFMLAAAVVQSAEPKWTLHTIPYREVDDHEILADVYRPAGDANCPVVVWIHGGGLIMGSREGVPRDVQAAAAGSGAAIVSID